MENKIYSLLITIFCLSLWTCQQDSTNIDLGPKLFEKILPISSGIDFENTLSYNAKFNIYTYRNFYNGGGVGIGDFNNDGLQDVYFSANMLKNKLYLNKGDFQFEDITASASVEGKGAWCTGVAVADVNADGLLDIYVCNSGDVKGDNKRNELFINNGDLTFSEKAEEFGLADQGYSTHAVFFDYDKDGDLDMYLLNNSYQAIGAFNLRKNERPNRDPVGGDKLFRNDNGKYNDVSEAAGIYGSIIGFGLGVTVGDIDQDGWQDLYISNDFFEKDYIYMNNGDGTFRENMEDQMRSISAASMGADMADINNDGYPEIFVTEMLPAKDSEMKQKTTFENWDKYQYNVQNDYYHQFTRNMLHLNNRDGTFSEIGRFAGVEATDWSWGALFFDMDNDGYKDIFVANGIYQDLTDQDYINFISNEETQKTIITKDGVDFKTLIDSIPVNPVPNHAFQNKGAKGKGIDFTDQAKNWGLDELSHSNGAAYVDLDNDGDLDLVVNNVNMPAFLYENKSKKNYLQFDLKGEEKNPFALGSKIWLLNGGQKYFLEHMPMRGFQSSMDYTAHFGLGDIETLEKVIVQWPNGKESILENVPTNQVLKLSQSDATKEASNLVSTKKQQALFEAIKTPGLSDYKHKENLFVDFDRDRLIYHMLSANGPKLAKGDVNGDGLEDVFIGGAKDQAAELYIQNKNGSFIPKNKELFDVDKVSEDLDSEFFDADNDGDLDLYVACGGNEFPATSPALKDRLYINDGQGNFTKAKQTLPAGKYENSSCVKASDFDKDGDLDLFVGLRLKPFLYGVPVNGYLLENDGQGNFKNKTDDLAPELNELGMITDVVWTDLDGDKDDDLLVIGEWMAIEVFINENGKFNRKKSRESEPATGWWNCVKAADLDKDGDMDLVLGNHGFNSRFRAEKDKPLVMYINDFDANRTAEQILCRYEDGQLLPYALKQDLVMQMPGLKKKYLRSKSYVGQTVEDMFSKEALENAVVLKTNNLASSIAINDGNGNFELKELPAEVQFAPQFAIEIQDFDKDGNLDILMAGNFHKAKPEVGRYDADYGTFLKGDGKNNFQAVRSKESGFRLEGEARDFLILENNGKQVLVVARNNDALQLFEIK